MFKRIFAALIGLIMCAFVLVGCQFIERDVRRDFMRRVATIAPVTDTRSGFDSGYRHIYKWQLVEQINQQFGRPDVATEAQVEAVLDNLIRGELMFVEIERMIARGDLTWRGPINLSWPLDTETAHSYFNEYNRVKQLQYDSIDNALRTIQRQILTAHGEEPPPPGSRTCRSHPRRRDRAATRTRGDAGGGSPQYRRHGLGVARRPGRKRLLRGARRRRARQPSPALADCLRLTVSRGAGGPSTARQGRDRALPR